MIFNISAYIDGNGDKYMGKSNTFIWGSNWWIEDHKAWFVEGINNILFCIDLDTKQCEYIACIPDENPNTVLLNPFCVKFDKKIFCLPGCSEYIWVYDLDSRQFSRIGIDNPDRLQLTFDFWIYNNKLFAVSGELKKIFEIDVKTLEINKYYTVFDKSGWARSTKSDNVIYSVSTTTNKIYQFDLQNRTIENNILCDIDKKLYTICVDGNKFWMSGYGKEIYVWDKEADQLQTINDFPQDFGTYHFYQSMKETQAVLECGEMEYDLPTFLHSVLAGKYIWFIPFQTNKIVYIDRENYELRTFEINEENETKRSLLLSNRVLGSKYVLEYVNDNRYIGLYSVKNKRILEIDAKKMVYQWLDYYLGEKCQMQYGETRKNVFYEGVILDRLVYSAKVGNISKNGQRVNIDTTGEKIYKMAETWH